MSLNSVKKNVIHREGRRSVHWIRWQKRKFTEFSDEFFTGGYSAHIWIPCNKSIQIPHTSYRGSRYNLSSRGSSVCEIMCSFKYVRLCKLSEVRRLFARFLLTSSSLLLACDGTSSQSWAFEEGTGFLVYCGWAKYWEKVARGRPNKCVVW